MNEKELVESQPYPTVHGCIVAKVKSVWPDRVQYKPYSYNIEMNNVFVAIPIKDQWRVHRNNTVQPEQNVVLTLDGMFDMLVTLAEGIEKKHDQSIRDKVTKYNR